EEGEALTPASQGLAFCRKVDYEEPRDNRQTSPPPIFTKHIQGLNRRYCRGGPPWPPLLRVDVAQSGWTLHSICRHLHRGDKERRHLRVSHESRGRYAEPSPLVQVSESIFSDDCTRQRLSVCSERGE